MTHALTIRSRGQKREGDCRYERLVRCIATEHTSPLGEWTNGRDKDLPQIQRTYPLGKYILGPHVHHRESDVQDLF